MSYRELLLGAGSNHEKRIEPLAIVAGLNPVLCNPWQNLTTLDMEERHLPNIVFDLNRLNSESIKWNPIGEKEYEQEIASNYFDEIHAYEVLEHFGAQGDFRAFFKHFEEFHRILKPGGYFCATVPHWASEWAWGDPGHTRVINSGSLVFLSQSEYVKQVGKTAMSDYRAYYHADFETVWQADMGESFAFILKAIK